MQVKLVLRSLKFKYQKLTQGYSGDEIWSLYYTLSKFILPRLIAFRNSVASYPHDFTNEKEWIDTLNKMIYSFELIKREKIESTEEDLKVQEGLELFGKYFRDLWY